MAFAAALSVHPVSSHATGEVVGQLWEALGARPDLVVLVATPGHRGALEDIAATVRSLLDPGALLAGVTTALGVGEQWVPSGPGLAAWAGRCGPVAAVGADGSWPGGTVGAVLLGAGPPAPPPAAVAGLPVLAGTIAGPVLVDGGPPGRGPVGLAFGPGVGPAIAVAHGLRGIGTGLEVTRAEGNVLYELDGRPALERLVDVARDGVPAGDLPSLGAGLHLRVMGAGGPGEPVPVLGADRTHGVVALPVEVPTGAVIQFAVPDPGGVRTELRRALVGLPAGALAFTTAPLAPVPDPDAAGWVDLPTMLPAETLACAVTPVANPSGGSAGAAVSTAAVAYFPRNDRNR